jgi:molybdopterin molybdotransferase
MTDRARAIRDVRMRGFAERADVEEVDRFLRAHARRLEAEAVPLLECVGRVLAEEVRAEVSVPGFLRSAMDGYAVRGEETFGASSYDPIAFRIAGEALPGRPFEGAVQRGMAVRIMTGAPLPDGADAVVMAEVCEETDGVVSVSDAVPPRRNVDQVGEDVEAGQVVLQAGRRIRPQDAGLLASIGVPAVACVRRPRVQLLITGNELLPPGERPEGAKIVDSNSMVLGALVARDGGALLPVRRLQDDRALIRAALAETSADVVLVSGGSSVGSEDFAPSLVAELGALDFHGISMRPSSPTGIGRLPGFLRQTQDERDEGGLGRLVFLLPGNPVSCLCAYEFFAGPSIRALGGRPRRWPHARRRLPLARKVVSQVGRTDYVRVAIEGGRAVPLATSGASILSSTVRAAGCVIVARELEGLPASAEVEVLLYDEPQDEED